MNDEDAPVPAPGPVAPSGSTGLTDGQWHRLHPATPLLRGGIALIAILGLVVGNMRERFIDMFTGSGDYEGDPIDWIIQEGFVGFVLLGIALGLLLFIAGFYISWRMHTFRITNEVVEVRSGILFRTNRRGRLDRIQGINIIRPFFARLFGAAKLEVNVAGQDANVQLAYLSSSNADALRRDILRLASGARFVPDAAAAATTDGGAALAAPVPGSAAIAPGILDKRVAELFAPELDPALARAESVVRINLGRLIGSIVLNDATVTFAIVLAGAIVAAVWLDEPFAVFGIFPFIIGMGSFIISRFTKSLRYSIAGTADGVRVGYGLFSTSNETLPPGRIHSVQVLQPLLWRGAGWWEIRVNRASKSSTQGASGQQNTTILPVGNLDEVMRVLALMLPGLVDDESVALLRRGMVSRGGDDGFVNSPRRALPLRWFSWRRNGYAFGPGVVLFRKGAIWRELIVVPEPRVQSVALHQGPLTRRLGLASIHLHTVAGPIVATLGAVDSKAATYFFAEAARVVVESASSDTSHRWGSVEGAPTAEPSTAVSSVPAPAPSTAPAAGPAAGFPAGREVG